MIQFTENSYVFKMIGLYIFVFSLFSNLYFHNASHNTNAKARLFLADAIVERNELIIDRYHHATMDKANFGNHYYTDKAPGMSLMALLPLFIYKKTANALGYNDEIMNYSGNLTSSFQVSMYISTILTSGILGALAVLAIYSIAFSVGKSLAAATLTAVTFGFATPAWGWATTFFGHASAGALLVIGFFCVYQIAHGESDERSELVLAIVAGACLAWAFVVEYPTAPASVFIAAYGLWETRDWSMHKRIKIVGYAIVSASIFILPLLIHNYIAFGRPLELGYSHSVARRVTQGYGLSLPKLDALWGITFGTKRGLFWISPILLAVPVGLVQLWRVPSTRSFAVLLGSICTYFLLFNASYWLWWGGGSVGPRHLTPALGFMCLSLVLLWKSTSRLVTYPMTALLALSIAISLICVSTTMTARTRHDNPLVDQLIPTLLDRGFRTAMDGFFVMPQTVTVSIYVIATCAFVYLIVRSLRREVSR